MIAGIDGARGVETVKREGLCRKQARYGRGASAAPSSGLAEAGRGAGQPEASSVALRSASGVRAGRRLSQLVLAIDEGLHEDIAHGGIGEGVGRDVHGGLVGIRVRVVVRVGVGVRVRVKVRARARKG